jgi:glycosyltransferase involved in cell wall biosynthesis
VATDVGSIREAVVEGQTGFLVPPGDAEGMAARIADILDDPARADAMGERGRRIVQEKFSCEAQLNRTHRLYERLLGEHTRTRSRRAEVAGADARH